jgi:hypothetical protein
MLRDREEGRPWGTEERIFFPPPVAFDVAVFTPLIVLKQISTMYRFLSSSNELERIRILHSDALNAPPIPLNFNARVYAH